MAPNSTILFTLTLINLGCVALCYVTMDLQSGKDTHVVGSDLKIVCRTEAYNEMTRDQLVSVTWQTFGVKASDFTTTTNNTKTAEGVVITKGFLYIKKITHDHAGVYLCQVKYELSNTSFGAKYDVQEVNVIDSNSTNSLNLITTVSEEDPFLWEGSYDRKNRSIELDWAVIGDSSCIFLRGDEKKCGMVSEKAYRLEQFGDGKFTARYESKYKTADVFIRLSATDLVSNKSTTRMLIHTLRILGSVWVFAYKPPYVQPHTPYTTICLTYADVSSEISMLYEFQKSTIDVEHSVCPGELEDSSSLTYNKKFEFNAVTRKPMGIFTTLPPDVSGVMNCTLTVLDEHRQKKNASNTICLQMDTPPYVEGLQKVKVGEALTLTCISKRPCASLLKGVRWDVKNLETDEFDLQYQECFHSKRAIIKLKRVVFTSNRTFTCVQDTVKNGDGIVTTVNWNVEGLPSPLPVEEKPAEIPLIVTPILSIVAVILFITVIVSLTIHIRARRARNSLWRALYNDEYESEHINENYALNEQAHLLTFDKKWEFPRSNLEIGKQLGSGNFGVVYQAVAKALTSSNEETTVAVKKAHTFTSNDVVMSMIKELKIMSNVCGHDNIVNLIGAVVDKLGKGELMIIVEYCPFGNLQKYLVENCHRYQTRKEKMANELKTIFRYQNVTGTPGLSAQPLAYQNVPEENAMPIDEYVLKDWALQLSKGMSWLSNRKVVHGDLAARNILLCHENIVKISDFGLSSNLHYQTVYEKKRGCPLPLPWLALESILKLQFSTKSDVWSYGVVLWEIYTFGRVPYMGIDLPDELARRLVEGYRLEKPEGAPQEMYDLMTECWCGDYQKRPTFEEIIDFLA